jgi:biopolymer transport protein ExbD
MQDLGGLLIIWGGERQLGDYMHVKAFGVSVKYTEGRQVMQRAIFLVLVTALMAAFTAGCTSTKPKGPGGEPQYAEKIEMTVGADQSMVMDGKKVKITDIPKQLLKANTSKYLIIVVDPESKLLRETLVTLLDLLKKDGYYFEMGEGSKYADVLTKAQG